MPQTRTVRSVKTTTDKWGNETTTTTEETFQVDSDAQDSDEDDQVSHKQRKGPKKSKVQKQRGNEQDSDAEQDWEENQEIEGDEEERPETKSTRASQPSSQSNLGFPNQGGLDAHNKARDGQGLPHLVWDDNLAAQARQVAEQCLQGGKLKHSSDSILYPRSNRDGWQGENLAMKGGTFPKTQNFLADAVGQWMAEERDFWNGNKGAAGHYTQVMWRDTQKVGMGLASNGKTFWVAARYWPAGNINNEDPF